MIANRRSLALVVDDEEPILKLMTSLLKINNIDSIQALSYKEALHEFNNNKKFDIVIVDYYLPDRNGEDLIKVIREKEPFTPILVFSGAAQEVKIDSYAAGANFVIPKPFGEAEFIMVVRNLISLGEAKENLEEAKSIIEALGSALEARDTYTEGHGERVAELSIALYDGLGLNDRQQRHDLFIGGLLHDIGKIGVPDSILKSENKLSDEEYEMVKKHTTAGYEICKGLGGIKGALNVIQYHHERLDGSGYPKGLDNGAVPMLAQIAAIADVYDAMTTKRTYRDEMDKERALSIMIDDANDGKLNKEFVDTFVELVHNGTID